jgi:nucleoid DNA-binding protein
MNTLTKYELAKQMKQATGMSREAAVNAIETLGDLIVCHFQNGGDRVTIRGFGTFTRRYRSAYVAKLPIGGAFNIPAKTSIHFRPSAEVARRLTEV